MENKGTYRFGYNYDTMIFGQIIVIVGGIVFFILCVVLTIIDPVTYIWFLFGVILFFLPVIFFIKKIYSIEYDANWFYLKRPFFKTKKISVDDFLEVRKATILFHYIYVVFKDKKVLTMESSKYALNFWNVFVTNKEYTKKHTAEVKMNIEIAKKDKVEYQDRPSG